MVGFCGHCYAALSDESRFCPSCGAPRPAAPAAAAGPVAAAPPETSPLGANWAHAKAHPWRVLQNAASIRLITGVFIIAVIPAALASVIHPVLAGIVFFAVFVPVWLLSAANPGQVLYCPYCRKRVKMGADACHHCGRVVTGAGA